MGQLDAKVPAPIYDENTIPKNNFETMFAQDYSGTSGNLQTDTNAVEMLSTATQNEAMVDNEEAPIEEEEQSTIMADLQLEDPVIQAPQAPIQPNTEQAKQRKFPALFTNDTTGAETGHRSKKSG